MDYFNTDPTTGAPVSDFGVFSGGIGPQSDGTYGIPDAAMATRPIDAGGGQAGQYSASVLDFFKVGVSALLPLVQNQQVLDYKRYEAMNGGLYRQGAPAGVKVSAQGGGASNVMVLAAIAIVIVVMMGEKA